MMHFISQMMKLPLNAFVYSMDMLVKTVQGLQRMAEQGIDSMVSGTVGASGDAHSRSNAANDRSIGDGAQISERSSDRDSGIANVATAISINGSIKDAAAITSKEELKMPDTNLSDDMLKLVRYKILFVKRDYEVAFKEQEELVWDNMTGEAFTAWKIAEFVQRLRNGEGDERTRVPERWRGRSYPSSPHSSHKDEKIISDLKKKADEARTKAEAAKGKEDEEPKANAAKEAADKYRDAVAPYWLIGFPEEDKKYLRVYFEVLQRYAREKFRYEERQVQVLEQIRDKIH